MSNERIICKLNNPHKASMHLAAGIPLVVWEESALADMVLATRTSIAVSSIQEAVEKVDEMSEHEYLVLKSNAERYMQMVRTGEFTRRALKEAMRRIKSSNMGSHDRRGLSK